MEGKRCCGLPRKVVLCTSSCAVCAIVIVLVTVLLTRPPDDIQTVEQTESDTDAADGDLTILKEAEFAGIFVSGSLALVREVDGNSSYLALNGFALDESCDDLELRLLQAPGVTSITGGGDLALLLPSGEEDFTEALGADFDEELYDQVRVGRYLVQVVAACPLNLLLYILGLPTQRSNYSSSLQLYHCCATPFSFVCTSRTSEVKRCTAPH